MRKRNTFIYYTTQLFHSLIFTIPIWVVYYQGKISPAEISILVTVQYLSQMFLELPSGALADLIGRRQTNFVGWLFGAFSFLLFPFATGFWHFLVLALMVGLMDSFRSGSEEALMYDTFKETGNEKDFDKVWANGNFIYQAGLVTGTALGGFFYGLNIFLPYVAYGVSLLIGAFVAFFYQEPHIDSEQFSLASYKNQITNGAKEAFKNEYTTYLSLFFVLVAGIAWSSTLYFNGYIMIELVPGDTLRGLFTAGMRLLNIVAIRSLLQNDRIFTWKRRIVFFPLAMLFGYLPGIALSGFWGLPFVQAAMGVTTARWILLAPLTNNAFSSKYRATAISLLSLLVGVAYVALTAVSAPIISLFGIKVMYSLLGVVTVITILPITKKLLSFEKTRFKYIKS